MSACVGCELRGVSRILCYSGMAVKGNNFHQSYKASRVYFRRKLELSLQTCSTVCTARSHKLGAWRLVTKPTCRLGGGGLYLGLKWYFSGRHIFFIRRKMQGRGDGVFFFQSLPPSHILNAIKAVQRLCTLKYACNASQLEGTRKWQTLAVV